jgi:hypothetical protein
MSGGAGTYPVLVKPRYKVYGAADSQDVGSEPVVVTRVTARKVTGIGRKSGALRSRDREDGLGEFYD